VAKQDWNRPTHFPLLPNQRRIRLLISYDGADFAGWQRQKGVVTVQELIEKALYVVLKEEVNLFGSGRTDAKVHAVGQVAHFDTSNQSIPVEAFPLALNPHLPHSIRVVEGELADEKFHARFTSLSREYRYYTKESVHYTPFERGRVGLVGKLPPLELLNGYAKVLIGTHDFSTFSAAGDQSHSRIRDLYESEFSLEPSPWGGDVLIYRVRANAFMMHQVRSMVGTMLQMGEKGEPVATFEECLASKERLKAGRTAPPGGLYLWRIEYA
jgi:tRNA pseudouridine38-40 synthase